MMTPDKTRQDWNARSPRQYRTAYEAKTVEVHHTVGPDIELWERIGSERSVRQIQDFHLDVRGWNDIFYNIVVTPDGTTWEGRPVASDRVLKLVFIGDFENGENPTAPQIEVLSRAFDVFDGKMDTHRWRARGTRYASACPGDEMITLVEALLAGDLQPPTGDKAMTLEEAKTRVNRMYVAVLGRSAEPAGRDFWAGEIADGNRSHTDVLAEFLAVRLAADKAELTALTKSMGKASTAGIDATGVAAAARAVFYEELRVLAEAE